MTEFNNNFGQKLADTLRPTDVFFSRFMMAAVYGTLLFVFKKKINGLTKCG